MKEKQSVCLTKLVPPTDLIDQRLLIQDSKITEELIKKLIKLKEISEFKNVLEGARLGLTAYQKPEGGIPITDLSVELQKLISIIDSLTDDSTDFGQVVYDSQTKRINFYSANDRNLSHILGSLDVTKFQTMMSGGTGITLEEVIQLLEPTARKAEMRVVNDGDLTYITLKQGTTARVINQHQDISHKQDVLVDSTTATSTNRANFKTVEGQSLLGQGNISIPKSNWNAESEEVSGYIKNKPIAKDQKLIYRILPPVVLDGINQIPLGASGMPLSMVGTVYHTNNNKIVRYIELNGLCRSIEAKPEEGLVYFNKQDGSFYRYGQENPGEDKKMIEITTAGNPEGGIYAEYDAENERLIFYVQSGVLVEGECLTLS